MSTQIVRFDDPGQRSALPNGMTNSYQASYGLTKSHPVLTLFSRTSIGGRMPPRFMDAKQTAEYLNMSLTWVYRDAPRLGLAVYKFGAGRNAKLQFKVSDVDAWARQQRLG
ncbi:helix-turn-helix domain-containing protein [Streptomyces sp. NPDC005373]|uniref:helix-turn-helix transcriptional regulator n=1 Tax=Streptomyces sp. NPDC005373 TaxID=3156879 RepID=UPI0033B1C2FB